MKQVQSLVLLAAGMASAGFVQAESASLYAHVRKGNLFKPQIATQSASPAPASEPESSPPQISAILAENNRIVAGEDDKDDFFILTPDQPDPIKPKPKPVIMVERQIDKIDLPKSALHFSELPKVDYILSQIANNDSGSQRSEIEDKSQEQLVQKDAGPATLTGVIADAAKSLPRSEKNGGVADMQVALEKAFAQAVITAQQLQQPQHQINKMKVADAAVNNSDKSVQLLQAIKKKQKNPRRVSTKKAKHVSPKQHVTNQHDAHTIKVKPKAKVKTAFHKIKHRLKEDHAKKLVVNTKHAKKSKHAIKVARSHHPVKHVKTKVAHVSRSIKLKYKALHHHLTNKSAHHSLKKMHAVHKKTKHMVREAGKFANLKSKVHHVALKQHPAHSLVIKQKNHRHIGYLYHQAVARAAMKKVAVARANMRRKVQQHKQVVIAKAANPVGADSTRIG